MKKKYLSVILFTLTLLATAIISRSHSVSISNNDELRKELNNETHIINSINPLDTNFADFIFLKEKIKDVDIIMLGEQQHGDGATFKAKSRMIKFLHKEMGFDVLVYESGLFDCTTLWDTLKQKEVLKPELFRKGLFWFWCESEETQPLLNYIIENVNTDNELEINGCDLQFSGAIKLSERKAQLIEYFNDYKEFNKDNYSIFLKSLDEFWKITYGEISVKEPNKLFGEIKSLRELIINKEILNRKDSIFSQYMSNIYDNYFDAIMNKDNILCQIKYRDSIMANNVFWLKNNIYKNRKIIIWAANSHIISNHSNNERLKGYTRMGEYIKHKYKESCYVMNFTSNYGETINISNGGALSINDASNQSIEYLLHDMKHEYSYIDFRDLNIHSPLNDTISLKCLGHGNHVANWSTMIDGLFYIDKMTPFNRVAKVGTKK